MKAYLHSSGKNLLFLFLVSVILSGCNTYKQVACPELNVYQEKHAKYRIHKKLGIFTRIKHNTSYDHRHFNTGIRHNRKSENETVTNIDISESRYYDLNLQEHIYGDNQLTGGMAALVTPDITENYFTMSDFTSMASTSHISSSQDVILTEDEGQKELQYTPVSGNDKVQKRRHTLLRSHVPFSSYPEGSIMLFAITSFVLGIVGIFTMPLLVGFIATIFGAVALGMGRRHGIRDFRGLAIAGLILGMIEIVVGIILLPFAILGLFF
jgi:hypothetical protein